MIPNYADAWGDEILARAEAAPEPPPPYRVTDDGIQIREDVLAAVVHAITYDAARRGPQAKALAALSAVFGKIVVVEDRLR